ncbi:MAG: cytochrome c-type biogenesis protein CcmH [Chloroflexi bacterium]|nr:cytochrome c-type biogenesis protein CcmH [Chloroflexota bacterium]
MKNPVRHSRFTRFTRRAALLLVLPALALLPLIYLSPTGIRAQDPVSTTTLVDRIGGQLVCQCGCASILINCVHQECMSRDEMMTSVKKQVAQGKSGEQIIQAFVQVYGEKVLAEPPKKGFNLTAWIAPFAGLLVGALLVLIVLRAWVTRGREVATVSESGPAAVDEEYLRRVEKELKETA